MASLASPLLAVIFIASAAAIWMAGIQLSDQTDVLSERLHLGNALGGTIFLAVATNLPEIAITVSAAIARQLDVAVGNILGGIAVQTVVLAIVDASGVRPRRPLTYVASSLTLVIEGAVVLAVLAAVVMGTQLPKDLTFGRFAPASIVITGIWLTGLLLLRRASRGLSWQAGGQPPDGQDEPRGHSKTKKEAKASEAGVSTTRAAAIFGLAGVVTLVAGVTIERSGETLFGRFGMSGVLFGATVLAAATSLPEVSTGLTSAKLGDYQLAISDIFGGNAFLPVLFLVATVVSGSAVLPNAHRSDIYLTGLGALLTIVYITGLVFRPNHERARLGPDSLAVVALYLVGIAGLATIAG